MTSRVHTWFLSLNNFTCTFSKLDDYDLLYLGASLDSGSTKILCYLALVTSPGAFIDGGPFPKIEGLALNFWKLTGSAPRSDEGARERALVKLHFPKIEGQTLNFWKRPLP